MSELRVPKELISYCEQAIESIDETQKDKLIDAIVKSRRIFIYGSGRSGLIGQLFAVRLVQLGFDVHFVGEMTTPIITKDDLTLLISYTGKTSSVVQTAEIAKNIVGSEVISVTGVKNSNLAKTSDVAIVLDVTTDDNTSKIAPLGTVFEDSAHIFFECVICDIMSKMGITEEEMRGRHAIWV